MNSALNTSQDLVELFNAYYKDIYNFVYFKSNRTKELAEDITQEVFMKAWTKRDTYSRTKASIRTWLYTIARNCVIDHYRKQKYVTSVAEEILTEKTDPEQQESLEKEILKDFVIDHFDILTLAEKELLVMRFLQEMEIDEIATVIGKQYSATKVAIYRALKRLQQNITHGIS